MRYKLRSGISFSSGPECAGLLIAIALRSSPGMMGWNERDSWLQTEGHRRLVNLFGLSLH